MERIGSIGMFFAGAVVKRQRKGERVNCERC